MEAYTDTQIQEALAGLNENLSQPWVLREGKLYKEFIFKDFVTAFGFMTSSALLAEKQNHHPEWFNVYKTVRVELVTHEAKGVTERDFVLAKGMEDMAAASRR